MKFLICLFGAALLAGCSDDTAPTGGGGTGGTGGSSTGGECDGVTCEDGEYCGFDSGCDGPRSCQVVPDCDMAVACGCDGENYPTACDAMATSGGVSAEEACAPPEGKFICTYEYQVPIYCELGSEYCKVEPSGNVYALGCEPLPEACNEPIPTDCDCLADPCSENYCGIDDENGAVTVLCPLRM